jgi:hypothetical protein
MSSTTEREMMFAIRKIMVTAAVIGMAVLAAPPTSFASASGVGNTTQPSAAAVPAANTTHPMPAAVPMGNPEGCGLAHFCSYGKTNGGGICYNTAQWYIKSWSKKCRTVGSVFNNGAAAGVRLYYLTNAKGAWHCLTNGKYLLYMTKDTFNAGPKGPGTGHGQPMANHVKSSKNGGSCK